MEVLPSRSTRIGWSIRASLGQDLATIVRRQDSPAFLPDHLDYGWWDAGFGAADWLCGKVWAYLRGCYCRAGAGGHGCPVADLRTVQPWLPHPAPIRRRYPILLRMQTINREKDRPLSSLRKMRRPFRSSLRHT
jgi:hypothetical protein